jgi:hypothetical protein
MEHPLIVTNCLSTISMLDRIEQMVRWRSPTTVAMILGFWLVGAIVFVGVGTGLSSHLVRDEVRLMLLG